MAKLPPADLDSTPELSRAAAKIRESRGWISNLMRTAAHSPEGAVALMSYGHFLRFRTDLTELQRELVVCATVRSVHYAWVHHGGLLRQLGMSEEQMASLQAGRVPEGLSDGDAALCAFIFAFSAGNGVPDENLSEVRRFFSDRQVMDASLLSAYYLGGGALITAFGVELEPPEVLQLELDWQGTRPH